MYTVAIIPWISFPIRYGLIDKCSFAIMLKTCSSTEIPPKPRRKAVNKILSVSIFKVESNFTPLVSSSIPENILSKKWFGIENTVSKLDKKLKKLVLFINDKITENITIKILQRI